MEKLIEFKTVLKPVKNMEALYIEFPYSVEETFGTRGQVKVKATFDSVPYRGSLANMGGGCHILIVRKDVRRQIGKNAGDDVWVTLQRDTEERVVDVPDDLAAAFAANAEAAQRYERLAFTHRKEYVQWINEAKRPETRIRRIAGTIEKLMTGKKNPTDK